MKIFGVGFCKTGTTSLGQALSSLGFDHCNGNGDIGNLLVSSYITGNLGSIFAHVENYDSFEDLPFCAPDLYKHLDKQFPDSKFVLTFREPESWFKSLKTYFFPEGCKHNTFLFNSRYTNPNLPLGGMYGLMIYFTALFGTLEIEKERYITAYNAYNKEVIKYFKDRPDDLLIVNWADGDGWKELCDFLGKKVPKCGFPHSNRNTANK